jgi:L-ascorbate metabolism protein UlaG (beta-lactamase superfamily)
MKITKLEQSGFILETESGYRLALDIGSYTPVEKLSGQKIDAMLVSHIHGDHFSLPHIKALSPKKLFLNEECIEALGEDDLSSRVIEANIGDTLNIDAVEVSFFDVDHGPNIPKKPRENFGFLIKMDGKKIYFAGDMFYESGMDVSNLEVDYALLPVGTFYTFGPEEAVTFAKKFKKIDIAVPMHSRGDIKTVNKFLELASQAGLKTKDFGIL